MKKYVCGACGWEYDEEKGAPELGILPEQSLKICPRILLVPFAL